jgi:hypothetical protein
MKDYINHLELEIVNNHNKLQSYFWSLGSYNITRVIIYYYKHKERTSVMVMAKAGTLERLTISSLVGGSAKLITRVNSQN